MRDVLLAVQIAICAVLVTSSLVAVRGLARSLHSNFGFVPQDVMLVESDLHMAGYADERMPQMQRRMLDAAAGHSGSDGGGLCETICRWAWAAATRMFTPTAPPISGPPTTPRTP